MRFSLVLPCYNEEGNVEHTVREAAGWFARAHLEGEIIAVDDGSSDRTSEKLEALSRDYPKLLRIVRHEKNRGYGAAVRSGCDAAREEVIGFMDSDGQFRPDDLALLLAHIDAYPFVTGRRRKRADPPIRVIFGKLLGILVWVSFGLWLRDVNCGLKVFRRSIWSSIRPVSGLEKFFNTEMFLNLKNHGIPWCQIDVPHYPRKLGNPTGGTMGMVVRMFKELYALKRSRMNPALSLKEVVAER